MGWALRIEITLLALLAASNSGANPATESRAQWQREDIVVFRKEFLDVDRSFAPTARIAAQQRLSQLDRSNGSMSPAAFAVELCRIAALADNGHTHCMPTSVGRNFCRMLVGMFPADSPWCHGGTPDFEVADFNRVPIGFYPFGDAFHVVEVGAENSNLLGARLVAVDGRTVDSIRAELRTFAGGTLAYRDLAAAEVLASPEQLHAVHLSEHSDALSYEFVTVTGQKIRRTFRIANTSATPANWKQLPEVNSASWAFQEPDKPFRYRDAPDIDALVVQLRQNQNAKDQNIADFLQTAEQARAALGRRNVVLDMRFNGGGNFLLTRDFMRRWPEQVPGEFFVLTSRSTFSAAITSIAYLKQAASDRVSIVGEPVGDRLMFFSDGLPVQLPHSGRFFLPAILRMDYQDGCRKYDDCFEAVTQPGRPAATAILPPPPNLERLPLSVPTLEPNVSAPWTIESWLAGSDPMMEAVTALVKGKAR